MNAVWRQVPEEFLEERRRLGLDKKDELWDGVLHMPPMPGSVHGRVTIDLTGAVIAIAKRRGLQVWGECTAIYNTENNYRAPDVSFARPDQVSRRGLEGAELVVEVLSPDDESREKLPFYAKVGVREVWLIDPSSRATEIFALREGAYVAVPFANGVARSPVLGITLEVIDGPVLRLRDGDDVADV